MGSNRKNIGERSEPSGGLGRGKAPPPLSPPQATSRFASLANFFFLFPPMRNLISSYSAPYRFLLQSPSFFFVFLVSSVEFLNELNRRRLLRSRETDGQEKPALSFKKTWKWCPPLYFQFSPPHCAPDSWTFFHQNILLSKTTILSLCHGVVK